MPETTTLVFVEGDIAKNNPAFTIFAPIRTRGSSRALDGGELTKWLHEAEKTEKVTFTDGGERALLAALGPDLWALKNAVAMLAAYTAGEPVDEELVGELVTATDDPKFWDDDRRRRRGQRAQGAGRAAAAARRRLAAGDALGDARAAVPAAGDREGHARSPRGAGRDLRARRACRRSRSATVSALASRYSWPQMRAAYERLLRSGPEREARLQDDESALQLLVHELCAMAPKGAAPRAAYAR